MLVFDRPGRREEKGIKREGHNNETAIKDTFGEGRIKMGMTLGEELKMRKVLKAAQAHAICMLIHQNDRDYGGAPYHLHPEYVADMLGDPILKAIAYLHDTVEDHPDVISIDFIRGLFDDDIADAVDAITRREGEQYFAYIDRVKQCEMARQVKLADLKHNMKTDRIRDGGTWVKGLMERYAKALAILEDKGVIGERREDE